MSLLEVVCKLGLKVKFMESKGQKWKNGKAHFIPSFSLLLFLSSSPFPFFFSFSLHIVLLWDVLTQMVFWGFFLFKPQGFNTGL